MKHKILVNPDELFVGMRVKLAIGGWWYGSSKKQIFVKGKIVKIGRRDNEIRCIIVSTWNRKYKQRFRICAVRSDIESSVYKIK